MVARKTGIMLLMLPVAALSSWSVAAISATWEPDEPVPADGRNNPLGLSEDELVAASLRGKRHALNYPVGITGEALPRDAALRFFKPESSKQDIFALLQGVFKRVAQLQSFADVEKLVGLIEYPDSQGEGVYFVPMPEGRKPWFRMGTSFIQAPEGPAITFSCATCHAGDIFGRKVIGLNNRFPRANEFFLMGRTATSLVSPLFFKLGVNGSDDEVAMYKRLRENAQYIDGRKPLVRGLDTSLAHVALSLSRRADDGLASKTPYSRNNPRDSLLRHQPADSKPAVWWNVKYKNKWLLDGSVVAGNPIFTNILWNEIGRGTDLNELSDWLEKNDNVIGDLTSTVFSAQAPAFLDFFPESHFVLERVQRGQKLFNDNCAFCHGQYIKGYERSDMSGMSPRELLSTIKVNYHSNTPVVNVGTDPLRAQGMQALAEPLNNLDISRKNGIVVKVQNGYVPPPLVGIWARWPYLHNNSVPSLCALLTPSAQRPVAWNAGEARSQSSDFDAECNGYPLGEKTPVQWKKNRWGYFDTRRKGMGNQGHDDGIFSERGVSRLSQQDVLDLVHFLQTL
jgi:mono/diheme cytochrome c family protein